MAIRDGKDNVKIGALSCEFIGGCKLRLNGSRTKQDHGPPG